MKFVASDAQKAIIKDRLALQPKFERNWYMRAFDGFTATEIARLAREYSVVKTFGRDSAWIIGQKRGEVPQLPVDERTYVARTLTGLIPRALQIAQIDAKIEANMLGKARRQAAKSPWMIQEVDSIISYRIDGVKRNAVVHLFVQDADVSAPLTKEHDLEMAYVGLRATEAGVPIDDVIALRIRIPELSGIANLLAIPYVQRAVAKAIAEREMQVCIDVMPYAELPVNEVKEVGEAAYSYLKVGLDNALEEEPPSDLTIELLEAELKILFDMRKQVRKMTESAQEFAATITPKIVKHQKFLSPSVKRSARGGEVKIDDERVSALLIQKGYTPKQIINMRSTQLDDRAVLNHLERHGSITREIAATYAKVGEFDPGALSLALTNDEYKAVADDRYELRENPIAATGRGAYLSKTAKPNSGGRRGLSRS